MRSGHERRKPETEVPKVSQSGIIIQSVVARGGCDSYVHYVVYLAAIWL